MVMYFVLVLHKRYRSIRGRPFDSEGGAWHFLEINILTLKMLEINNLSSSGKKKNNLTLICLNLGEKCKIFQKFSARFARDSSIWKIFLLALLAFNYNIFTRDSSISNFSGSLRLHLIITWLFDYVHYTSLFLSLDFNPLVVSLYPSTCTHHYCIKWHNFVWTLLKRVLGADP